MKCPICKGTGKIEEPINYEEKAKLNAKIAKDLIKAGYSFRQAMRIMGYKSPSTIQHFVNKV